MIHTFTISYQISHIEYYKALEIYNDKQKYPVESKGIIYFCKVDDLSEKGLKLKIRKNYIAALKKDYFCYELTVNPSRVIGSNNPTDVYEPEQFIEFVESFEELIKQYRIKLPPLYEWKADRIDFCLNIRTPYLEDYMLLLKRADISDYKIKTDKNNHQTIKSGSLYVQNKSVTINIYCKSNQMQKHPEWYTAEQIEAAEGILRIEIQAKKKKIESLVKKHHLPDRGILDFLQDDYIIAADVLLHYTKNLMGIDTHIAKNKALTKIEKSNFQKKTKEEMKLLVNRAASTRLDKVKEELKDLSQNNYRAQQFAALGINVLTINLNRKVKQLPSIYTLLQEKIERKKNK